VSMSETNKHVTAERITAIATVIIAVAALWVAVWQGCETRRHNRLSVKPHLTFLYKKAKGSDFIGLFLFNKGVGPAIVDSFEIYVDNESIAEEGYGGWKTAIARVGLNEDWIYYYAIRPNNAIEQGEEQVLLGISRSNQTPELLEKFHKAYSRIRINIKYKSIYEDSFEAHTKKITKH